MAVHAPETSWTNNSEGVNRSANFARMTCSPSERSRSGRGGGGAGREAVDSLRILSVAGASLLVKDSMFTFDAVEVTSKLCRDF